MPKARFIALSLKLSLEAAAGDDASAIVNVRG
jgi:hypothetical protein